VNGDAHRALYLAGSGSFAVEVAEWARDGGWSVMGLIELLDRARVGTMRAGLPVIAADDVPPGSLSVLAVGGARSELWSHIEMHGASPATVVHPSAHVSPTAALAAGCIVGPGAVIGAETAIDAHTLVSRGALIGHHSRVGAFVSLMPGANVGGHAEIGDRSVLGMGAIVINNVSVGSDATVAAGAVVVREIRAGVRVQGVPARVYVR
jgi:acetyltransferase EpsM